MHQHIILFFDAAHSLPNYDGNCHRLHGHTWKVEFELELKDDTIDAKQGFAYDFKNLRNWLKGYIIDRFDHRLVNDEVEIPTCENLAKYIYEITREKIELLPLSKVTVWETPESGVSYP